MEEKDSPAQSTVAFKLACAFWIVLVVAFLVEATARAYILYGASDDSFRRYASLAQQQARADETNAPLGRYVPHRYVGHIPRPSHSGHNTLGYRGPEIPMPKPQGEFRIVCLGGTETYGAEHPYPDALEATLKESGRDKVRVINAGAEEYLSHESLMNLQFRVLDLDPDMVIVYHGASDLLGRMVWPPESYASDNSGMKRPAATGLFMPSVFEYCSALRIAGITFGVTAPHGSDGASLHVLSPNYFGDDWREQMEHARYPSDIFTSTPIDKMVRANAPTHFERNLTNIVLTAQANGVVPLLVSFRFADSPDLPIGGHEALVGEYAVMNQLVRDVATSTGAPFYDFASADGATDLAAGLAKFLVENGLAD